MSQVELQLIGDWSESQAAIVASSLQKSLGMGDAGGIADDLSPPVIQDVRKFLSDRQKKLLEQLGKVGRIAFAQCAEGESCDDAPDWSEYSSPLGKALLPASPAPEFTNFVNLALPVTDGEFGQGVYLAVGKPAGGAQFRYRLNFPPTAILGADEFLEVESDLTKGLDLTLDGRGVRAIAHHKNNAIQSICVRSTADLIPLGSIAAGGDGEPRIVALTVADDHLVADIELVAEPLTKAASKLRRSTWKSDSYLDGTKLIRTSAPHVDRVLVRKAIERCKLDGIDFTDIQVCMVSGVPDFLSKMTRVFCLPSDGVINICPHDPQAAIASLCQDLSDRLQSAVRAGAMPGDVALEILARGARLNPQWYLEMCIKRMVGAILCDRAFPDIPPAGYLDFLSGRGVEFWGDRQSIYECMAEDYRCAHDPAGLPNMVAMEFDAAVPALARTCQQALLGGVNAVPA